MKVLVVGGTRFMGVATVERLLARGHAVTVFNRGTRPNPWPERVRQLHGDRGDVQALALVADGGFDAIIDFCAYTAADSRALLAVCSDVQRLVHISSGAVYRFASRPPWAENSPYGPEPLWGAYARGKIDCELVLRAGRSGTTATTSLRMPWVLGPGSYADRERFVLNRLLDGEELLLPGDGQALQQFVSVEQVADAVVAAVESFDDGGWMAFNIASPGCVSLEDLVRICAALAGVEPRMRLLGLGPTGTPREAFEMADCVFPHPNQTYTLDLSASERAGIAPAPISLEEMIEPALAELRAKPELRSWARTASELEALGFNVDAPARGAGS